MEDTKKQADSHDANVLEPDVWNDEEKDRAKDADNDSQGDLGLGPGKADSLQLVSAL